MEAYPQKRERLKKTVESMSGHDELIIVSNWREGYAVPINKGLALAKGQFLCVSNDDIDVLGGNLKDMCDENSVVSPTVNGQRQDNHSGLFSVPKQRVT